MISALQLFKIKSPRLLFGLYKKILRAASHIPGIRFCCVSDRRGESVVDSDVLLDLISREDLIQLKNLKKIYIVTRCTE